MEGASTITYSNSSISDSMMEATKDFVIKLLVDEDGKFTSWGIEKIEWNIICLAICC